LASLESPFFQFIDRSNTHDEDIVRKSL